MNKQVKYQAKYVYWDAKKGSVIHRQDVEIYRCKGRLKLPEYFWRFDSQHEFKVYLELCRIFGADRIEKQFKVEIFPPSYCYPRGKTWKVDFAIKKSDDFLGYKYFIEAKGAFLPEFAHTLASFECLEPDKFERLYIVFGNTLPKNKKVVRNLFDSPIKDHLLTLKQLENLIELP